MTTSDYEFQAAGDGGAESGPPRTAAPPPAAHYTPPAAAPATAPSGTRSPVLACLLSLMPGLGQVYLGYYRVGFIHAGIFAGTITLLAAGNLEDLIPLLSIFLAFFFFYNIVDAGRRAVYVNRVLAGGTVGDAPPDLQFPRARGSLGLGIVLVVAGLILLTQTALNVSLAWLEDWWPVIPILVGAWLIARELMERSTRSDRS